MKLDEVILKVLDIQKKDSKAIFSLLIMGFFMGVFLACLDVGASALFLNNLKNDEIKTQLPIAIVMSGFIGVIITSIYNFFQNKVSFTTLGLGSLLCISLCILFIHYSFSNIENPKLVYFFAFAFILPANFIVLLTFWGAFGRMFSLRQSKRIIGNIDTGQLFASIIALFSIPVLIKYIEEQDLLLISLFAIIGNILVFYYISNAKMFTSIDKKDKESVSVIKIIKNKYLRFLAFFIIISAIAITFVNYSFLEVTNTRFQENELVTFLSLFEGTIVIFSFLFQTFVTDRIISMYGLRVALLINPILIGIFTIIAIPIGSFFGVSSEVGEGIIFFFIIIAVSKLFSSSLKDALDSPTFKLYFLPLDKKERFDVQTKIEGIVVSIAEILGGGLILLIYNVNVFTLIHISIFTIPVIFIWYLTTSLMHQYYKNTLRKTLIKNKNSLSKNLTEKQYSINEVLENEVNSQDEDDILVGLKLMEEIEPIQYENTLLNFLDSSSHKVKKYVSDKISDLNLDYNNRLPTKKLAYDALENNSNGDLLSITEDKIYKLSKSINKNDRILCAKILRSQISDKNIFILLELLRDLSTEVKKEAIITSQKVKRSETWGLLIEMLNSTTFKNLASCALVCGGEEVLQPLENAFQKTGQSRANLIKIIQIMGRIGGDTAQELLWQKIEYPDRSIVKQILLSLEKFDCVLSVRMENIISNLLDKEMSKVLWNMAALTEIPDKNHFQFLKSAIEEEIKENFNVIVMYMSKLYDPESVQLIFDNIESKTTEGIAFAIELADIFMSQELKQKLFPLVDDISINEKILQLQSFFPREKYDTFQVLNFLLNKNYNEANKWTKACAIHCLAFEDKFKVNNELIAQIFNKDKMLYEIAAWVIYHKNSSVLDFVTQRIDPTLKKMLYESISKNRLHDGLDDGYYMDIEIVMYLKKLTSFKNIPGLILCDMVDKINNINLKSKSVLEKKSMKSHENIYIIAEGEVYFMNNEKTVMNLKKGDTFENVFKFDHKFEFTSIVARTDSVIFYISIVNFYNLMAEQHEFAQKFIQNTKNSRINTVLQ